MYLTADSRLAYDRAGRKVSDGSSGDNEGFLIDRVTVSGDVIAHTPIPAALPLFASALAGGGLLSWRKRRRAAA